MPFLPNSEMRINGVPIGDKFLVLTEPEQHFWEFKKPDLASFEVNVDLAEVHWPWVELLFGFERPRFSGPWRLSFGTWYRTGAYGDGMMVERRVDLGL